MSDAYFDVQLVHARRMEKHGFKAHWSGYRHYSFLLALEGTLYYQMDDSPILELEPPFLFWNHPDHRYRYGHVTPEGKWTHCYAAFAGERAKRLMEQGFMQLEGLSWISVENPDYFVHGFDRIVEGFQQNKLYAAEEAILLLESMLLELKKQQTDLPHQATGDTQIGDLMEAIRQNPQQPFEFEKWASNRGMSYSSFRQRFKKQTHLSPGRFLIRERMNWARRQVIETRQPLQEIGFSIGYENPSVFSRAFSQFHGISASALRNSFYT